MNASTSNADERIRIRVGIAQGTREFSVLKDMDEAQRRGFVEAAIKAAAWNMLSFDPESLPSKAELRKPRTKRSRTEAKVAESTDGAARPPLPRLDTKNILMGLDAFTREASK